MGVLHGIEHLLEEPQTVPDGQALAIAVLGDGSALDVLERQVGLAGCGHAGVVKFADVRVHQRGQDVALAGETFGQSLVLQRDDGQFERDLPFEDTVRPLRQPHGTHAAMTQFADQPVSADDRASGEFANRPQRICERWGVFRNPSNGRQERRGFDRRPLAKDFPQRGLERAVLLVQPFKPCLPFAVGQIQRLVEQPGNGRPLTEIDAHRSNTPTHGLLYCNGKQGENRTGQGRRTLSGSHQGVEKRSERSQDEARRGEKAECTQKYMSILSSRATTYWQAQ